jgi:purine-nucleoside phosphorylase
MINRIKSELLNLGLKFIDVDEKIVRMFLETKPDHVNDIVILPTVKAVMKKLVNKLDGKNKQGKVYNGIINGIRVSIIQCHVGAPNMAIMIESLRRTKAKKIIRVDFCGGVSGLSSNIDIGDVIIPNATYCGDGTSPQYILKFPGLSTRFGSVSNPISRFQSLIAGCPEIFITTPHEDLTNTLFKEGRKLYPKNLKKVDLWTTDALFCETTDFLNAMRAINVEAIDMESSVMFLLGIQYNLKTSAILAVSDLPGTEYDLLETNEIHPDMENGIDRAIQTLVKSLPQIKNLM